MPTEDTEELTVLEGELIREQDALSPTLIGKIYEEFLLQGRTIKELALRHNVPIRELIKLAEKHSWIQRRGQLEMEELTRAEGEYRKFIVENKLPAAKAQYEASKAIISKLTEMIDIIQTSAQGADMKLKRISEALKAAADVGARTVGMTDTPISDYMQSQEKTRPTLIVVGASAMPRGAGDAL